jgi:hypothetical protein
METPEALRSPPIASRESRRLLSSTPFQSSFGECLFNPLAWIAKYPYVAGRKQRSLSEERPHRLAIRSDGKTYWRAATR